LTTPVQLTAGNTYAVGTLLVGTTMPTLLGSFPTDEANSWPRLCSKLSGQSDLPATITDASTDWNFIMQYVALTAA